MNTLLLFRHSDAENSRGRDADRQLTLRGREKIQLIAGHAKEIESKIDIILSSPLIRARQTSEIISGVYGIDPKKIVELDELAEGFPSEFIRLLKEYSGKNIVCVGHMPSIVYLATGLTSGSNFPIGFSFFTGQFIVLDFKGKYLPQRGVIKYIYKEEAF
ncbi:MAG: histidine phosphatase family protein [Candidatus Marinimicrobia bacterium]|nr:histidine phosphatase family protein [Candidatus Neomarinimicrobiota bacterium]